jgi:hypothetical protein
MPVIDALPIVALYCGATRIGDVMAKQKTDEDRQAENLAVFKAWLKANGKMILPIPNRGVVYAGLGKTNLKKMKDGLQEAPETTPMWKIIEKAEKDSREITGYVMLDTINDVLKRLKSPLPKLVEATGANAGHPKKYSDMLSCVEAMASDSWALLPKSDRRKVWGIVSEKYADNLKGDVQVWEGVSKRLRLLEPHKVLVQKELDRIRKNKNVSPASRKKAEDLIKKYEKHYGTVGRDGDTNDQKLKASYKKAIKK